jgi:hypothetical protein
MHEYSIEPGFRFEIGDTFSDKGVVYEIIQIQDNLAKCELIANKYEWIKLREGHRAHYSIRRLQELLLDKRIIALPRRKYQCFDCKEEFEGDLHYLCSTCREKQTCLVG